MENSPKTQPKTVHNILAYSYSIYLFALVAGVFLDVLFPIRVFSENISVLGMILLIIASALVVWAQNTSRALRRMKQDKEKLETTDFCRGPYCVSRSPTHWGLFLLVVSLGFLLNSVLIIVVGIIAFLVSKGVFLRREENLLVQKYGEEYLKYKKQVKL